MKRGQLAAGLIAALIVGVAVGYLLAPSKTTVETITTPTTVTQEITQTVTATETLTQTVTAAHTVTQTVTQTMTVTQTVTATPPGVQLPLLRPVYASSAVINGTVGGAVEAPPLLVVVPPGTYVKIGNSTLKIFNLTVVLYPPPAMPPPDNSTPVLTFAYFVNGYSGAAAQFVDSKGRPKPLITMAEVPNLWTSWAYAGYTTEGLAIRGGRYVFENRWIDAGGYQVNLQFIRPIAWVFTRSDTENPASQRVEVLRGSPRVSCPCQRLL
jgi:hypothetical protein